MLHQVGVGALGPVFRTYEPTRDRLVAVKVFRLDVTPEQAQSLADELAAAADAGLFHPSVVEPIAAGVEGTVAYRAEEYVAAETLDVALRHYAPAPIDKVLLLITQLAGAIDFARSAGVGHGALHPRDIFVTPEEARATGFGVVEALERVGLRAPVRRPYSAPERVSGGAWGTPADVFSLAAIAYELLTGRRPAGTGAQIGTVSGTTAGHHPGALHAVFVQAMDDDPARRYQTALGFASALDAASRGEAPMSTYERGAIGAAAAAPAFMKSPAPVASTPAPAVTEDFESEDVDEDEPVADERDEVDVPALQYEAGDIDVPNERSLFDQEPLEELGLEAPAVRETNRFADEFSVAAADLRTPRPDLAPFDEIDEIEAARDRDVEDVRDAEADVDREPDDHVAVARDADIVSRTDRSAARVHAQPGSTLFGHDDVVDTPSRGYVPPVESSYSSPSIIEAERHDHPRRSMMGIALFVFGVLLGAGGVYALLTREDPAPAQATDQAGATPAEPTPADSAKPFTDREVQNPKPD
ncbi:MAG TPA: protein kinase, partial [Vicinamibacterales bacterium]|nr:protein kinase [Vicinamibacterales bacterium]